MNTTEEQVSIKDLQGVDIFAGLSDHDLEQIAKVCSQRTYQAGERCAREKDTTDELVIVSEGKVALEMRVQYVPYNQIIGIGTLTKGNMFAWSALVEPHVLTASVRCTERTRAIRIKASDLHRIFEERPSIERVVMKNLATIINYRLRDIRNQLVRLVVEMIKQGK